MSDSTVVVPLKFMKNPKFVYCTNCGSAQNGHPETCVRPDNLAKKESKFCGYCGKVRVKKCQCVTRKEIRTLEDSLGIIHFKRKPKSPVKNAKKAKKSIPPPLIPAPIARAAVTAAGPASPPVPPSADGMALDASPVLHTKCQTHQIQDLEKRIAYLENRTRIGNSILDRIGNVGAISIAEFHAFIKAFAAAMSSSKTPYTILREIQPGHRIATLLLFRDTLNMAIPYEHRLNFESICTRYMYLIKAFGH